MNKVPFIDLHAQYLSLKKDLDQAIHRVVISGRFEQGSEVVSFEEEFARYIHAKYCVSLNSGTDALILGIRALELSAGDEIIVPSFTFSATSLAILENGLKPVFVDVDENYGLDLVDLKKKITTRTKAIIVVHLYGQPDKIGDIKHIINKSGKKIHLIEDACQAHGATYKNTVVGNFGIFAAFSFYPTKNLGAYGDGGALITNSTAIKNKMRLLKQYGEKRRYFSETRGVNSRLDTLQAAILRTKLIHLSSWNKKRRELAKLYTKYLTSYKDFIKLPKEYPERKAVYHLYVIRTKKREALMKYLSSNGIPSLIHYPIPLHLQKVNQHLGYRLGSLPNVEKITKEVLSIPFYAEMSLAAIKKVSQTIGAFYSSIEHA